MLSSTQRKENEPSIPIQDVKRPTDGKVEQSMGDRGEKSSGAEAQVPVVLSKVDETTKIITDARIPERQEIVPSDEIKPEKVEPGALKSKEQYVEKDKIINVQQSSIGTIKVVETMEDNTVKPIQISQDIIITKVQKTLPIKTDAKEIIAEDIATQKLPKELVEDKGVKVSEKAKEGTQESRPYEVTTPTSTRRVQSQRISREERPHLVPIHVSDEDKYSSDDEAEYTVEEPNDEEDRARIHSSPDIFGGDSIRKVPPTILEAAETPEKESPEKKIAVPTVKIPITQEVVKEQVVEQIKIVQEPVEPLSKKVDVVKEVKEQVREQTEVVQKSIEPAAKKGDVVKEEVKEQVTEQTEVVQKSIEAARKKGDVAKEEVIEQVVEHTEVVQKSVQPAAKKIDVVKEEVKTKGGLKGKVEGAKGFVTKLFKGSKDEKPTKDKGKKSQSKERLPEQISKVNETPSKPSEKVIAANETASTPKAERKDKESKKEETVGFSALATGFAKDLQQQGIDFKEEVLVQGQKTADSLEDKFEETKQDVQDLTSKMEKGLENQAIAVTSYAEGIGEEGRKEQEKVTETITTGAGVLMDEGNKLVIEVQKGIYKQAETEKVLAKGAVADVKDLKEQVAAEGKLAGESVAVAADNIKQDAKTELKKTTDAAITLNKEILSQGDELRQAVVDEGRKVADSLRSKEETAVKKFEDDAVAQIENIQEQGVALKEKVAAEAITVGESVKAGVDNLKKEVDSQVETGAAKIEDIEKKVISAGADASEVFLAKTDEIEEAAKKEAEIGSELVSGIASKGITIIRDIVADGKQVSGALISKTEDLKSAAEKGTKEAAEKTSAAKKGLITVFGGVKDSTEAAGQHAVDSIISNVDSISREGKQFAAPVVASVANTAVQAKETVGEIHKKVQEEIEVPTSIVKGIQEELTAGGKQIIDTLSSKAEVAKDVAKKEISTVQDGIAVRVETAVKGGQDQVSHFKEKATAQGKEMAEFVAANAESMKQETKKQVAQIQKDVNEKIGSATSVATGIQDDGKKMLESVVSSTEQVMKESRTGIETGKEALINIIDSNLKEQNRNQEGDSIIVKSDDRKQTDSGVSASIQKDLEIQLTTGVTSAEKSGAATKELLLSKGEQISTSLVAEIDKAKEATKSVSKEAESNIGAAAALLSNIQSQGVDLKEKAVTQGEVVVDSAVAGIIGLQQGVKQDAAEIQKVVVKEREAASELLKGIQHQEINFKESITAGGKEAAESLLTKFKQDAKDDALQTQVAVGKEVETLESTLREVAIHKREDIKKEVSAVEKEVAATVVTAGDEAKKATRKFLVQPVTDLIGDIKNEVFDLDTRAQTSLSEIEKEAESSTRILKAKNESELLKELAKIDPLKVAERTVDDVVSQAETAMRIDTVGGSKTEVEKDSGDILEPLISIPQSPEKPRALFHIESDDDIQTDIDLEANVPEDSESSVEEFVEKVKKNIKETLDKGTEETTTRIGIFSDLSDDSLTKTKEIVDERLRKISETKPPESEAAEQVKIGRFHVAPAPDPIVVEKEIPEKLTEAELEEVIRELKEEGLEPPGVYLLPEEDEKQEKKEKTLRRVERRFERMASETFEAEKGDQSEAKTLTIFPVPSIVSEEKLEQKRDSEFERMVSQLSTEEVAQSQQEYISLWDEGGLSSLTPTDDWESRDPDTPDNELDEDTPRKSESIRGTQGFPKPSEPEPKSQSPPKTSPPAQVSPPKSPKEKPSEADDVAQSYGDRKKFWEQMTSSQSSDSSVGVRKSFHESKESISSELSQEGSIVLRSKQMFEEVTKAEKRRSVEEVGLVKSLTESYSEKIAAGELQMPAIPRPLSGVPKVVEEIEPEIFIRLSSADKAVLSELEAKIGVQRVGEPTTEETAVGFGVTEHESEQSEEDKIKFMIGETVISREKQLTKESSVDSEVEFISKYGEESVAFDNSAFTDEEESIPVTDRRKEFEESFQKRPPPVRKSIYERSMSLPAADIADPASVKTKKRYFEAQMKREIIVEQLMTQVDEEYSPPEHKSLIETEKLFEEVEEQPDDQTTIVKEVEFVAQQTVKEVIKEGEDIADIRRKHSEKLELDLTNAATTAVSPDAAEALEFKRSESVAKPSDSLEVHVDKSEIECSEKGKELDELIKSIEKEVPTISVTGSELKTQETASVGESEDTQSESDITPEDIRVVDTETPWDENGTVSGGISPKEDVDMVGHIRESHRIGRWDGQENLAEESWEKSDDQEEFRVEPKWERTRSESASPKDPIVYTPEEHYPDTVWEVPVQEQLDAEEITQDIPIEKQTIIEKEEEEEEEDEFKHENQGLTEVEAKEIAAEIVEYIEREIEARGALFDVAAYEERERAMDETVSTYIRQLAGEKNLDEREVELIESILAKKQREEIMKFQRSDTGASSVEITDEDLRSSGVDIDLSPGESATEKVHDTMRSVIQEEDETILECELLAEGTDVSAEIVKTLAQAKESLDAAKEVLIEEHKKKGQFIKESSSEYEFKGSSISEVEESAEEWTHEQKTGYEETVEKSDKEKITKRMSSGYSDEEEKSTGSETTAKKTVDGETVVVDRSHKDLKDTATKSHETHLVEGISERSSQIKAEVSISEKAEHLGKLLEQKDITSGDSSESTTTQKVFEKTSSKDEKTATEIKEDNNTILVDGSMMNIESKSQSEVTMFSSMTESTEILKGERITVVKADDGMRGSSEDSQEDSIKSPPGAESCRSSSSSGGRQGGTPRSDIVMRHSSSKDKGDRLSAVDLEPYSSSGESHYYSFSSRPCSSDVEALIASGTGTTGSSEYESAISQSRHTTSGEYVTAVSSLSSRESIRSLDSESSGHLASIEISSEASETLIASALELDRDVEGTGTFLLDDDSPDAPEIPARPLYVTQHSAPEAGGEFSMEEDLEVMSEPASWQAEASEDEATEAVPTPSEEQIEGRMKRSQEMTFQPEPRAILVAESLDGSPADALLEKYTYGSSADETASMISFQEERLGSSLEETGSVLSMSLSTASEASGARTIIEISQREEGSLTKSCASIDSGSREELDSFVMPVVVPPSSDVGTSTPTGGLETKSSSVTITTSSFDEFGASCVSTQVTSLSRKSSEADDASQSSSGPTQTSDDGTSETSSKKSHRRKESTSSFVPSMLWTVGETKPAKKDQKMEDDIEERAESDQFSEPTTLTEKEVKNDEKKESDDSEKTEESHQTEADQAMRQDIKGRNVFVPERAGSPDDFQGRVDGTSSELEMDYDAHVSPVREERSETQSQMDMLQEKHELEARLKICPGEVPGITVTQHMVIDRDIDYPDLELEEEEPTKPQEGTPQTPASISSRGSSSSTDQGREYIVNEDERKETASTSTVGTVQTGILKEEDELSSPNSDSFELLDKPDITDEYVIIEEVGKEADENDQEGKALKINAKPRKTVKKKEAEEELVESPPQPATKMTDVQYFPKEEAGPFPFESDSPPTSNSANSEDNDFAQYELQLEESKKWIEMQFQAEQLAVEFERQPLEDIKEEELHELDSSSKIGSMGSHKSLGSFGSIKGSFSSTPDYDVLAGKKYFSKGDTDDVSMSSLQEFEILEKRILDGRKSGSSGSSQDSLSCRKLGTSNKSLPGEDVSSASLKEFETMEKVCISAVQIEKKVKEEEAALLSEIDEGHESQVSESESCETMSGAIARKESESEDFDRKMFEIDEIIKQAKSNVEGLMDFRYLEKTESVGRGDSLEEVSRIPDLEFDHTEVSNGKSHSKQGKVNYSTQVVTKKQVQKWREESDLLRTSNDSPDFRSASDSLDVKQHRALSISTDSIELEAKKKGDVMTDSIELGDTMSIDSFDLRIEKKGVDTISVDSMERPQRPISEITSDSLEALHRSDSLELGEEEAGAKSLDPPRRPPPRSDYMLGSTDSLDPSSSAATHATYQYETDSVMSSSFTSGGSNTLVSDGEHQDFEVGDIPSATDAWFENLASGGEPFVTEVVERIDDDGYSHTIHRTVETAPEVRKVVFTGPGAESALKDYIEGFGPGEDVTETEEIDEHGNIHIKRVIQRRIVVRPDEIEDKNMTPDQLKTYFKQFETQTYGGRQTFSTSDIEGSSKGDFPKLTTSSIHANIGKRSGEESGPETAGSGVTGGAASATDTANKPRRRPLFPDISMDDEAEFDPTEHDWRKQVELLNAEADDAEIDLQLDAALASAVPPVTKS